MTEDTKVQDLQGEIALAEQRIENEIRRIVELAEFQELYVLVNIQTKRRLNGRELVEGVDVRIRAVI